MPFSENSKTKEVAKQFKRLLIRTRETIFWNLFVIIIYLVSARLGLHFAVIGETVTLFWPPSGIALAALLIGGYRLSIGVALGALIVNAETSVPLLTVFIISIGNTLEPLCATYLLRRLPDFSLSLDKVSDVLALLLIAACGSTLLAASFGSLGLFASNLISSTEIWPTWSVWWLGDGMGILVISPVLLTLFDRIKSSNLKVSRFKIMEALVLAVLFGIIGEMIFNSAKLTGLGVFPVSLSMFPFAIWSALRFGTIGAGAVALIASMIAINGTVNGTGPFAVSSRMDSLILWCLYADLMAVTGLFLAAVDTARQNAVEALKLNNQSLEKLVQTRTAELIQANKDLQSALAERRHLQLEMNLISEERQKMIGQELHDGLGQLLTGISFLVSSLNETLEAKLTTEASGMQQIKSLLRDAVATVRALSRGLYPVEMESQGFKAALKQLAYFTQKSSNVHCKVKYPHHSFVIDKAIALNLYRIAQEAIHNALRHGKADWIEINLLADKNHYTFTIDDDGFGFPYRKVNSRLSLGLRSMHSRAELIGAVIEVREKLGGGTSIIVTGSNQY